MATALQLIEEVKIDFGQDFDNSKFNEAGDEYFLQKLNGIRSTLIREQLENKKFIEDAFYQFACCYSIVCEKTTCTINGNEVISDGKIFTVTLPDLMPGIGDKNITFFGDPNISVTGFDRKTIDQFILSNDRIYSLESPIYTQIGNKAYLKNLPVGVQVICMKAILNDPATACSYRANTAYPVPSYLKLRMLFRQEIATLIGIPIDNLNDTRDTTPLIADNNDRSKQ